MDTRKAAGQTEVIHKIETCSTTEIIELKGEKIGHNNNYYSI